MNLFYASLILAFSSLFFIKNKTTALSLSFLFLFIPWGLQYEMTQDWDVNMLRWTFVNVKASVGLDGETRELEPFYTFILKACKPLTFYGFLMLSGFVELFVIFLFIRKYVSPRYYWVSIFILMMKVDFGLLIINSNRQSLSIVFIMIGVYLLLDVKDDLKAKSFKSFIHLLLSALAFILAPQIHGSAYIGYFLIPIFFLVLFTKKFNRIFLLIICNALFFSRFIYDVTKYQYEMSILVGSMEMQAMDFSGYLEGLENNVMKSYYMLFIEWSIINLLILFYHKLSFEHRFFGMAWIVSCLFGGFLIETLARITLYLSIFILFVAPQVFELINKKFSMRNIYVATYYTFMIVFLGHTFIKNVTVQQEGYYYYRWSHFQTLFEAPEWY